MWLHRYNDCGHFGVLKCLQKKETLWCIPKGGGEYRRLKVLMGEFCSAKPCIYSIHVINAMF